MCIEKQWCLFVVAPLWSSPVRQALDMEVSWSFWSLAWRYSRKLVHAVSLLWLVSTQLKTLGLVLDLFILGSISGDSMSIGGMGLVPSFGPPGVDCDAGWLMAFPGSSLQMFPLGICQNPRHPWESFSQVQETKWHQYLGILNLQTFEHYPWVEHTSRSCIQSDPSHPKLPDTSGCLSPPPGTCKSCNAFNFEDFLCRLSRNQSHHAPGRARWFFPFSPGILFPHPR